jgi:hypothetical protein
MAVRKLEDCIRVALGGGSATWEFTPEDQFGNSPAAAGAAFADFLNSRCVDKRLTLEVQGSRTALAKLALRPNTNVDGAQGVRVSEGSGLPTRVAVKFGPAATAKAATGGR